LVSWAEVRPAGGVGWGWTWCVKSLTLRTLGREMFRPTHIPAVRCAVSRPSLAGEQSLSISLREGTHFRIIVDAIRHFGSEKKAFRKAIWNDPISGLDLWFIQHNFYRMPQTTQPAGQNKIGDDVGMITDVRLDSRRYDQSPKVERLVFAKLLPGRNVPYTFVGRYAHELRDEGKNEVVWKRTSETFSIEHSCTDFHS
jgi:hypothetical protein